MKLLTRVLFRAWLLLLFVSIRRGSSDNGLNGIPLFVDYQGVLIEIEVPPDASIRDVILDLSSKHKIPVASSILYSGQIIDDHNASLADLGIGPEARLDVVSERDEIILLFEALMSPERRLKLLGFPDYASMDRVFPDPKQKANFLASSRSLGFGNGIIFDQRRKHIIKIYWTALGVEPLQINFEAFYQMQYLQILHLANNQLSGYLDLKRLPDELQEINLMHNRFSGTLDFKSMPRELRRIDLSNNRFQGTVHLSSLPPNLRFMDLRGNAFSGQLVVDELPPYLELISLFGNEHALTKPPGGLPTQIHM